MEYSREQLEGDSRLREIVDKKLGLAHEAIAVRARDDVNIFAEYVFGHKQHPWHRELQRLYTEHDSMCVDAPVEHGKSTQTLIRVCWEIGRNPNVLIGYFSNSATLPERQMRVVVMTLNSERYKRVFPEIKILRSNGSELFVERETVAKDPTLVCMGIGGAIIGSRLTHIVLDDIQDFDNTWTEHERRKLWSRIESTVSGRRLAGGKLWDIGTPWNITDARHQLRKTPGFTLAVFDAVAGTTYRLNGRSVDLPGGDPLGLWSTPYKDPISGQMYGWPPERLEKRRKEMTHMEFDRQFRCKAASGSLQIFGEDHILRALKMGRGFKLPGKAMDGEPVLTAIDLAVSRESYADKTVLFTGTVRMFASGFKFVPLDVRSGRWELMRIVEEARDVLNLFPQHMGFTVENNQAQDYIVQLMDDASALRGMGWNDAEIFRLRVRPHTTGTNKWNPVIGVRAMAADFENDKWILPADADGVPLPEVNEIVDGLLGFDPGSHTADHVMAMWIWVEQARRFASGYDDLWARVGLG